jgi:hypothetical protein
MAFDTINLYPPILFLIPSRVMLGLNDVCILPEEVAPFPKPHANVEDRLRL